MVRELNNSYITQIKPDFIYNRFDLFCNNYIVLLAEQEKERHVFEARIFDNYVELGIWKMQISYELLKELSLYIFQKYPHAEYVKFFFCKTNGNFKKVKHFSIDFPDSVESFLQRRSSKSRHRLNKQRHQAEREIGSITFQEYTFENFPEEVMRNYNLWKDDSYHIGKIDDSHSHMQKYHITNIYVLYFGENMAAMMFSCEQCPVAYLENFSFNTQYSRYSPGQQIYEYVMTRLIEKKFKSVFLAGGDYDYKRKYGSIEEDLYDGFLFRNTYCQLKHHLVTYYNKHLYWKLKHIKSKLC